MEGASNKVPRPIAEISGSKKAQRPTAEISGSRHQSRERKSKFLTFLISFD
jgi:hypothetical protein